MASAKWPPFCLGLNVLMDHVNIPATDNMSQQNIAQQTVCIFYVIYCMCSDSSIKPHYMVEAHIEPSITTIHFGSIFHIWC